MHPARTTLALCAVALVATAGCGQSDRSAPQGGNPESGQMLVPGAESVAATDVADVLAAQDTILITCDQGEPGKQPTVDLPTAVRTIVRVTSENPDGRFASGRSDRIRTMRTVASDNAATLRECGRTAEAAQLERLTEKS